MEKIAEAWETLMLRLGYDRYGAQGGDWGAAVTTQIGRNVGHCAAIHLNMPIGQPSRRILANPTDEEQARWPRLADHRKWGTGYSKQQSTRPQTLGYGLVDSPAGQLAWIVEKFWAWTDCDGHPENALSRDELLDNVMVYWVTDTAASSARLYWESFAVWGRGPRRIAHRRCGFPRGAAASRRAAGASRSTTSPTGPTCRAAGISPRSNNRSCSSRTSARSSRRCAEEADGASPSVNLTTRHAEYASPVSHSAGDAAVSRAARRTPTQYRRGRGSSVPTRTAASTMPPCSMPSSSSRVAQFSSSARLAQPKPTWSRPIAHVR